MDKIGKRRTNQAFNFFLLGVFFVQKFKPLNLTANDDGHGIAALINREKERKKERKKTWLLAYALTDLQ